MYNYRKPSYLPDSRSKRDLDLVTDVTPGLAVTPAQMLEMTENHVAISSFGMEYNEGSFDTFASSGVPLERQRGVDIVDVWQTEKQARYNLLKSYKDSKQNIQNT